jgi:hypothetical protein
MKTSLSPTNARRFIGPEGQLLATYVQTGAHTLYAEVGWGRFISPPLFYFDNEVREISPRRAALILQFRNGRR